MTDPLTPEEVEQVVDIVSRLDSFGGMLQKNPGVVAILCWLLGFLLREIIIYSNIMADWLRKFLRVDGIRKEKKNDCKSDK